MKQACSLTRGKRASRHVPPSTKATATAVASDGDPAPTLRASETAGTTQKQSRSVRESSCAPKTWSPPRRRASAPSTPSSTPARTTSALARPTCAASSSSATTPADRLMLVTTFAGTTCSRLSAGRRAATAPHPRCLLPSCDGSCRRRSTSEAGSPRVPQTFVSGTAASARGRLTARHKCPRGELSRPSTRRVGGRNPRESQRCSTSRSNRRRVQGLLTSYAWGTTCNPSSRCCPPTEGLRGARLRRVPLVNRSGRCLSS